MPKLNNQLKHNSSVCKLFCHVQLESSEVDNDYVQAIFETDICNSGYLYAKIANQQSKLCQRIRHAVSYGKQL